MFTSAYFCLYFASSERQRVTDVEVRCEEIEEGCTERCNALLAHVESLLPRVKELESHYEKLRQEVEIIQSEQKPTYRPDFEQWSESDWEVVLGKLVRDEASWCGLTLKLTYCRYRSKGKLSTRRLR